MAASRRNGEAPRTRADQLQAEIADAIVSGRFLPGVRLDEQGLADTFGTSRTPVREALRQLALTGLIEVRPHRGAIVSTMTPAELAQVFETMAELEAGCARYAALRMSAGDQTALRRLHQRGEDLARVHDPDSYAAYNLEFHDAIYAGGANPHLTEMTAAVRTRLTPYRGAQFRIPDRARSSQIEHGRVVDAIMSGDGAAAAAHMREHILIVGEACRRYVGNLRHAGEEERQG